MSDEKLYLIATNELDFDNRDEAVWAKSMALHKGDEHEARYKYISTRVEQLATENASSESMPITQSIVYSPVPPLIEVAEFANSNGISIDEAIPDSLCPLVQRIRGKERARVVLGQG